MPFLSERDKSSKVQTSSYVPHLAATMSYPWANPRELPYVTRTIQGLHACSNDGVYYLALKVEICLNRPANHRCCTQPSPELLRSPAPDDEGM